MCVTVDRLLLTDLHEELGWWEDAQADREEDPAFVAAPRVVVVHQLLTDLAVNLIPAKEKQWHQPQDTREERAKCRSSAD